MIEPRENSCFLNTQTVPGICLFFIFVLLMIAVALVKTAATHSPLHKKMLQHILQILLHPIPRKSDYIIVVAFEAVDVLAESSLDSISAGFIVWLIGVDIC